MRKFCLMAMMCLVVSVSFSSSANAQKAEADEGITALVDLLGQVNDPAFHLDLLKGINEALKGRRKVVMPASWPKVYPVLAASPNQNTRIRLSCLGTIVPRWRKPLMNKAMILLRLSPSRFWPTRDPVCRIQAT